MAKATIKHDYRANPHLAGMKEPFNTHYFYYLLADRLEERIKELFNDLPETAIKIPGKTLHTSASAYIRHRSGVVDRPATLELRGLLFLFLGVNPQTKRPNSREWNLEKIKSLENYSDYCPEKNAADLKVDDWFVKPGQIKKFWLKARRCDKKLAGANYPDVNVPLMNLLAFFCGYGDFKKFLDKEFGVNYNPEKDQAYQNLKKGWSDDTYCILQNNRETYKETYEINYPSTFSQEIIIGREKEFNKLEIFLSENFKVLIQGEGGMGKTTIASSYYVKSLERKYYKYFVWLYCENGIFNSLDRLSLIKYPKLQKFSEKERNAKLLNFFHKKGKKLLLILDNANDPNDLAIFFNQTQGLSTHMIVTSRCRIKPNNSWKLLELNQLTKEDARTLFLQHYTKPIGREFSKLFDRLLNAISHNTLLIELFAKRLEEESIFGYKLSDFLKRLEQNGLYLDERVGFTIQTQYTSYRRKIVESVDELLDIIYDFSNLKENLRKTLVNFAVLPAENHKKEFLLEIFQPESKIDLLAEFQRLYIGGWITGDSASSYRINPVLQTIVLRKNRGSIRFDSEPLLTNLATFLEITNWEIKRSNLLWIEITKKVIANLGNALSPKYQSLVNNLTENLRELSGIKNLNYCKDKLEEIIDCLVINSKKPTEDDVKSYINLALVLRDISGPYNYNKSLDLFNKAIENAIVSMNEKFIPIIKLHIATVLRYLGGAENLESAKNQIEGAIEFERRIGGQKSVGLANMYSTYAIILRDIGGVVSLVKGKELLKQSEKMLFNNFGEKSYVLAARRSNRAVVLRDLGGEYHLIKAKKLLERALQVSKAKYGDKSPPHSFFMANMALILLDLGGHENLLNAKRFAHKSYNIDMKNFAYTSQRLAVIRSILSIVLRRIGGMDNLIEASNLLRESKESAEQLVGQSSHLIIRNLSLATTLVDIGDQNGLVEAEKLVDETKKIFYTFFKEKSILYALILLLHSNLLVKKGNSKDLSIAIKMLQESMGICLINEGKSDFFSEHRNSQLEAIFKQFHDRSDVFLARDLLRVEYDNVFLNKTDLPLFQIKSQISKVLISLEEKEGL